MERSATLATAFRIPVVSFACSPKTKSPIARLLLAEDSPRLRRVLDSHQPDHTPGEQGLNPTDQEIHHRHDPDDLDALPPFPSAARDLHPHGVARGRHVRRPIGQHRPVEDEAPDVAGEVEVVGLAGGRVDGPVERGPLRDGVAEGCGGSDGERYHCRESVLAGLEGEC